MGPVKHLGLSRAHGDVSSFAVMQLHFRSRQARDDLFLSPSDSFVDPASWENESIASAVSASTSASASASASASSSFKQSTSNISGSSIHSRNRSVYVSKEYKSTTVRSNSNPIWPTVQSPYNTSVFKMDLEKRDMPKDGMEMFLHVQMREERTAADAFVPVKGGGDGILGQAQLNLTPLALRGFGSDFHSSSSSKEEIQVDVWDEWVDLVLPSQSQAQSNPSESQDDDQDDYAGKIRILISYEPCGFSPRRGDAVALEAFARQPLPTCTFRPILSPLHPMRVKDVRGEYLLCTFDLQFQGESNGGKKSAKEGSLRLHRNTVFVIERTNMIDSAINVAMKPADAVLSTHIGQEVTQTLTPYVESAGEWDYNAFQRSVY